jgi:hypothetical protein
MLIPDYQDDSLTIAGTKCSLEGFRQFLIHNFRILVERSRIGSHLSGGRRVITYDWEDILTNAIAQDIHYEYKNRIERL